MEAADLSVRAIQLDDIEALVQYWKSADAAYLNSLGADIQKMPTAAQLAQNFTTQIAQPYSQKTAYATIWLHAGKAIGHCNVNKISFGDQAYLHLHLWQKTTRKKGLGSLLVKKSLAIFFENLQLQRIYCEPYALNAAPNRTLARIGFDFEKEYVTIPGALNFEQPVKRWCLTKAKFEELA